MSHSPDPAGRPASILIVDDEAQSRALLEGMLTPEGYHLRTAASGEEALAMVALEPPDLIILDLLMPRLDGYQVTGKIKGARATEHIPVVMITGRDDHDTMMLGLKAGADDFLTKPVDRAELCVRVRNLLRLKAYGDYHDTYSRMLEGQVESRTADLVESDRRAASALRRERDRAQRYLDTAEVVLLALDTNAGITLVNRYACSVLGWTADELLGHDWIDTCLPVRTRDAFRKAFAVLLEGELSVAENPILTKSGEERLIEWRNVVQRNDTGRVTGVFSSGTDITERERAIEALRITEERMRFALTNANVGIWDMDCATGVVRWSEIIELQYGLKPGTFGGTFKAFIERIHPDDRASVVEIVEKAMKSGADFSIQNRSVRPDGAVRWLCGAGRFQLGERGEAVRGVCISQDVTARRTLEQQYQQAQKMDAIGQLASGVAHDFNNLLTVIIGCAELMTHDGALTSQHGEDLGEIVKAARLAASLTKQLLAFGRRQVLRLAPLDVNRLITDMGGMLTRLIGDDIKVVLAPALTLHLAHADRGQLEQVVMNLVVNARDAMPDGGSITIRTADAELEASSFPAEAAVPGHYVMVAVTDTGSGMTPEIQRRLFEPFFTTKELGKGTGLGLSTVYGIVKQSKGYISVHSEPGYGTTFNVYLPRASGEVSEQTQSPVVAAPARGGSSATLLLVEDDSNLLHFATRILENAGHRVWAAENGAAAERLFADHADAVDLVVTDVVMPGCNGPDLLDRLRTRVPALRVLYMSGNIDHPAMRKAGIDRDLPFVQKPFTAAELRQQVRDALDRESDPSMGGVQPAGALSGS